MNAETLTLLNPHAARFDAQFIEDNHLIERYLDHQLPSKGARDLEKWCRANPEYLESLKLSERAAASLELLEAGGRPLDLSDPRPPWWKSSYVLAGLCATALVSLLGFWMLFGKYVLLRDDLEDALTRMHLGPLVQPATLRDLIIAPDRSPGTHLARITVTRSVPQLIDLHIDMSYLKDVQYRLVVDKQGQGRALIVSNLLRDSNGELRLTFNTTGLAAGIYDVRIETLPFRGAGSARPAGWILLEVR